MTERPVIRCWVARLLPDGRLTRSREVYLEDAPEYHKAGWAVLVDPDDQAALARWEQLQRSMGEGE